MSRATETQNEIEATVTLTDGTTYETRFDRKITWYIEGNYGADADGNRGREAIFYDSDDVDQIEVLINDEYQPLRVLHPSLQFEIEAAILEWCIENIPSVADLDDATEPEPENCMEER